MILFACFYRKQIFNDLLLFITIHVHIFLLFFDKF